MERQIKYLRLPDEILDTVKEQQVVQQQQGRGGWQGERGGRGGYQRGARGRGRAGQRGRGRGQ